MHYNDPDPQWEPGWVWHLLLLPQRSGQLHQVSDSVPLHPSSSSGFELWLFEPHGYVQYVQCRAYHLATTLQRAPLEQLSIHGEAFS